MEQEIGSESPVALITGGARGIGFATAEAFVACGYRVVVVDVDGAGALAAADRLGGDAIALGMTCDVSDDDDVDTVLETIRTRFGQLDTLLNNAGGTDLARTQDVTTTSWARLIDVHLGGTFRMSRGAFDLLRRSDRGSIVNISSINAQRGIPGRSSYNSAKAAIESFSRSIAVEWAPVGIRVNCVAPGFTLTEGGRAIYESGAADMNRRIELIPMGRMGRPEEIAEAVVWLASPKASYVTGQTIVVDGGYLVDGRTGGDDWVLPAPLVGGA